MSGLPEEKSALIDLAQASGLNLDPTVLELLVELISLGVQPKDIAPYLRAVIARSAKPAAGLGAPPAGPTSAAPFTTARQH